MGLPRHLSGFKARTEPLVLLRHLRQLLDERGFAHIAMEELYLDARCGLTPEEIMSGYAFPPDVLPLLQEAVAQLEKLGGPSWDADS